MSTPNWGNLVNQGRCRAIGVPWTQAEAEARGLGIPAHYVRAGILTLEDYEAAKEQDDKKGAPLERKTHQELVALAQAEGIEFTSAAPDTVLIELLRAKQSPVSKAVKAVKKAVAPKKDKKK